MPPVTELLEAIIASLIFALGLIALALASLVWKSRDRALLWFGLFGWLYGIRLAGESELVQPLLSETTWHYLGAFITYAILAPFALFIEALFGAGWRNSLRWAWKAALVWAVLAMGNDLIRHQPGASLWLNPPAVLTFIGIGIVHVVTGWRRERWPPEARVAIVGGLVFIAAALYETLGGETHLEPLALLVFMTSLGYFVAHRTLAGELRLRTMTRELALAHRIQQSILPPALVPVRGLRVAARYFPMHDIGGDFYDFDTQTPDRLGLIVADVSGHGVPAALVASMVKIAFVAEADQIATPGRTLQGINRALCGRFKGAFVTACCGVIDLQASQFRFASAGHPGPWLRRGDGQVERLSQPGLLLAFDPEAVYATTDVHLSPGDRLLFFSDGLLEASNGRGEFFGEVALEPLFRASAALSVDQLADHLLEELRRWIGANAPLQDDITLVVVDFGEAGITS